MKYKSILTVQMSDLYHIQLKQASTYTNLFLFRPTNNGNSGLLSCCV